MSVYLASAILIPCLVGLFSFVSPRNGILRDIVTVSGALIHFFVIYKIYQAFSKGEFISLNVINIFPGGNIEFIVEPLGMLFSGLVSILWLLSSIYAIGYMRAHKEERLGSFFGFFAFAISATIALAYSSNLFALFVFYEILTFITYPLVSHHADAESQMGARRYILILVSSSVLFFLPAIVATYYITGTLDFKVGGIFPDATQNYILIVLSILFVYGIGKAALMPMHKWLPSAMVAPAPVSALLHAVAVVKAGVFSVLKIVVCIFGIDHFQDFGGSDWLVYIAGISIVLASSIALVQDNLKSRLAYSTISQLAYVVLAAGIATPLAIIGACVHIVAHGFSKITLFFAAGSIYLKSHIKSISKLDGLGKRMPWTMGAFGIGALGMIGIPPTAGFLGKWFILSSAVTFQDYFVLTVLMVSTILNAAYFLPIIYGSFFKEEKNVPDNNHGDAPIIVIVPICITALISILLFCFPNIPVSLSYKLLGI